MCVPDLLFPDSQFLADFSWAHLRHALRPSLRVPLFDFPFAKKSVMVSPRNCRPYGWSDSGGEGRDGTTFLFLLNPIPASTSRFAFTDFPYIMRPSSLKKYCAPCDSSQLPRLAGNGFVKTSVRNKRRKKRLMMENPSCTPVPTSTTTELYNRKSVTAPTLSSGTRGTPVPFTI